MNRLVIGRQPLLLLVSSASLLPLLLPARDVRGLPLRLGALVNARLRRLGVDLRAATAEEQAMHPVLVAPTNDRSVLGIMVDFAKAVPHYLHTKKWDVDALASAEERLAETPCHAGRPFDQVVFPNQKAPDLLRAKWLASENPQ